MIENPGPARAAGTLALMIAAAMPVARGQVPSPPLNDSGQGRFYDASAAVPGSPPTDFPGQDAGFGRDPAFADGALAKTGGGDAGFDFSKLDAGGQPLAIQDQAWARDAAGFDAGSEAAGTRWSCVFDHTTGLVWEVKSRRSPADLQDRAWTYSWFSNLVRPDGTANGLNGGHPGSENRGTCLDRYDPVDNPTGNFCDTAGYVAALNAAGLCGASDWRMPTLAELAGLVHYGRRWPAIDAHFFPNVPGEWGNPNIPVPNITWTATPSAVLQDWAWSVYFEYGALIEPDKQLPGAVRLVRGPP